MTRHLLRTPSALNPPGRGIRLRNHAGLELGYGAAGPDRGDDRARARRRYGYSSGNGDFGAIAGLELPLPDQVNGKYGLELLDPDNLAPDVVLDVDTYWAGTDVSDMRQ